MIKALRRWLKRKNKRVPTTRDSIRWNSEDNRHIIDGYELFVAMQITLPKRLLQRHGEIAEFPLDDESQCFGGKAIWLPLVKPECDLASDIISPMSSPMGPIETDGGKLLPYLIAAREIIEAPIPNVNDEIGECLQRVERIKSLSAGDPYVSDKEYFVKNLGNEKKALLIVIDGAGIYRPRSLLAQHIIEAHEKGYRSINEILSASDDELLSIKGIGEARLKKIRAGQ